MTYEQRLFLRAIVDQVFPLPLGNGQACQVRRQRVWLKYHIDEVLWIRRPEFGAEKATSKTILAYHHFIIGQAQMSTTQKTIHYFPFKAVFDRRTTQKVVRDLIAAVLLSETINQALMPAGMHHPKVIKFEKQWQLQEPIHVFPLFIWPG